MAQEDEILSLHDALLASVTKSENSRNSCGDDDEINDEELTALRFAALISKKSKRQSKPQPIGTTVPAVPTAAPVPQNQSVLPVSTVSQHLPQTHLPTDVFTDQFPAHSYRQHFPPSKHGAGSQFLGHQKRTSNLIVIQTHQPQHSKKDTVYDKAQSFPMNNSASVKSVFLRPQDKWDKSREDTKQLESLEPKVSAKFRRLMSRDSDSDDDDSDEESEDGKANPESLFIRQESDDESKSVRSDVQSENADTDSSIQSESEQSSDDKDESEVDSEKKDDQIESTSPNNDIGIDHHVSESESSREPSPDASSVLSKSSISSHTALSVRRSRSPAQSDASIQSRSSSQNSSSGSSTEHSLSLQKHSPMSSSKSPSSHVSCRHDKSSGRYSRSPSSVQSDQGRRSLMGHSSSTSLETQQNRSPLQYSRSPSPRSSSKPQHSGRSLRCSRSRSPPSPVDRYSKSPLAHSYERNRTRRRHSGSLSPDSSQGRSRLVKRHSGPYHTNVQDRSVRRRSPSPVSHGLCGWNRSQTRYAHELYKPPRRHSGSGSPSHWHGISKSQRRSSKSPHSHRSTRSPIKRTVSPSKDRSSRRNRSLPRYSQSPHRSAVRRQSSSPKLSRSPHNLYLGSAGDAHSPGRRYYNSGLASEDYQSAADKGSKSRNRTWQDYRCRNYREKHLAGKDQVNRKDRGDVSRGERQRSPREELPNSRHLPVKFDRENCEKSKRRDVDRRHGGQHSPQNRKGSHSLHYEECTSKNRIKEKNSEEQLADNHQSASPNKENKYHRVAEHGAEDCVSGEKSPVVRVAPKHSASLSAKEQAKLEARQRKFSSLSEVRISRLKKISLKDIVRNSGKEKHDKLHKKTHLRPGRGDPSGTTDTDSDSNSDSGRSHEKGRRERKVTDIEIERRKMRVAQHEKEHEKRRQEKIEQLKASRHGYESHKDKGVHLAGGSSGMKSVLSVVASTKGSREISYRQEEVARAEKTSVKTESKSKALEDARQIILRVKQKVRETKSPEMENTKKEELVSGITSPTINVTFNEDQSRLPVYKRLGQPMNRHEKIKTSATHVASEVGQAVKQMRRDKTDRLHNESKTLDLRNILESRKDNSEARAGFKRKSKGIDSDRTSAEKKKIRLKRPGRADLHSVVVDATE